MRFSTASGIFAHTLRRQPPAAERRVEMWRGGCRSNISVAAPHMGVIRSRGFVPSFSPFVSDPKSEPSVIRPGLPVLVSTSHTVAARRRSYQYPAYGRAGAQDYCPLDDNASCDIFPKCDEKLSRQCRDHDLADPSTFAGDTLLEPMTEQRIRLMSQPQPGQLDHGCPQPRVSRFGDPLFAVGHPTLPWCRRKSGVSANLSPVVKVAE